MRVQYAGATIAVGFMLPEVYFFLNCCCVVLALVGEIKNGLQYTVFPS